MNENRFKSSEKWTIFRTVHIVVGIMIIVMSIMAFINPDENKLAFPAIFALAALLNFLFFVKTFRSFSGDKKQIAIGLIHAVAGLFLAVVAIIAVITL